eukprot:m.288835 g.288835  ORF g.288835 m.288835 type:complete len:387 (+) comp12032_c0_seq1:41-1201(+)
MERRANGQTDRREHTATVSVGAQPRSRHWHRRLAQRAMPRSSRRPTTAPRSRSPHHHRRPWETAAMAAPMKAAPFRHQVGGHTVCARIEGENLIAKPLASDRRELLFYQTLAQPLTGFVPVYRGVERVVFPQRVDPSSSTASSPESQSYEHDDHDEEEDHPAVDTHMNPWSQRCFQKYVEKRPPSSQEGVECLLLEDLTSSYNKPCVLDLKMGTRTYAVDASEAKRLSHTAKCEATTSAKLGLRLCGMQVYDPDTSKFVCRDKYHGRTLTVENVRSEIKRYLSARGDPASLIESFLASLTKLRETLLCDALSGYRFYSSSLLLLYEGAGPTARADIRMIDFAHTSKTSDEGPDEGYILGITNLISQMQDILDEDSRPKRRRSCSRT